MAKVNFISTVLAKYRALETRDASTLYFIEDAKRIYKGDLDVTEAIKVVNSFAATPGEDIVPGKIYINASTFESRIKQGGDWIVMQPGRISSSEEFKHEDNAGAIPTVGAIKAYITQQIADITGGTAFLKDVTWSTDDGVLKVDKGEEVPASVELTNVAHSITYDKSTLKLNIPIYGREDLVVDIPKDNFIRSGKYEKDYNLGDGTTGPAIVLVVDDEDPDTDGQTQEIVIPAAALVDIYTGDVSQSARVTVSDDNKIKASIILDPQAGNALVCNEAGLMVDISSKADKLTSSAANHVLVGSTNGNLADSGTTIRTAGELGQSNTEIPVASVIAAAIATALQNVQNSLVGEGAAGELIISTQTGVVRSGKKIGSSVISASADADTLATEAAVIDAMSWKTLG